MTPNEIPVKAIDAAERSFAAEKWANTRLRLIYAIAAAFNQMPQSWQAQDCDRQIPAVLTPLPYQADVRLETLRQRFEALAKQESDTSFWQLSAGELRFAYGCTRAAEAYRRCADELARVLNGETPPALGEAWEMKEKSE